MKGLALGIVALGICLASAAPSFAHDHWGGYYYGPGYHHYHGGPVYYRGYGPVVVNPGPVVVAPAPAYGYAAYPPYAAGPAYPAVVPVPYPAPYYGPSLSLGFRGRGVSVGVGL